MNTLTVDEVKAIYKAQVTHAASSIAGWDAGKSTRVEVHAELQRRNPPPYSSITPEMLAARDRREPLTFREKAADTAHQLAQVTDEHHAAFQAARAEGHLDVKGGQPGDKPVADAHHYAQKLHGMALWAETERLVTGAVPS